MARLWLLFTIVLLFVVGCGGGGGDDSGPAVPIAVSIEPASVNLAPGGTRTFSVSVTGTTNQAVTWTATGGTITQAGVYTAPQAPGTYQVRATSAADSSKVATAQVTVAVQGAAVIVSPERVELAPEASTTFAANVTGLSSNEVNWTATGGEITPAGVYTAPGIAGEYTVFATSKVDSSKRGSARVVVTTSSITLQITPPDARLGTMESQQFAVNVFGTNNKAVTWSTTGGTITASGLYTAPATPGTYQVTATSVQDPRKSATVNVYVGEIIVEVNPSETTVLVGRQVTFTARVTAVKNRAVAWTASGGTINAQGLYTAPNTPGTYTVRATSVADPSRSDTATVRVVEPTDLLFDFETGTPTAFSPAPLTTSPSGQRFLGRFGGTDQTVLTLSDLSPHRSLTITFNLYVIGSFDGTAGDDNIRVEADGTERFRHNFSNLQSINQSYPSGGENPPGTGRVSANTLGYTFDPDILYRDTVYRITLTVPHTATTASIRFSGELDEALANESWGLDNVRVVAEP